MLIPIPRAFTIPRCWSYLDYHHQMVIIPRIVTIPRMVTNATDQTGAPQLLFRYRTSFAYPRCSPSYPKFDNHDHYSYPCESALNFTIFDWSRHLQNIPKNGLCCSFADFNVTSTILAKYNALFEDNIENVEYLKNQITPKSRIIQKVQLHTSIEDASLHQNCSGLKLAGLLLHEPNTIFCIQFVIITIITQMHRFKFYECKVVLNQGNNLFSNSMIDYTIKTFKHFGFRFETCF